jgi:biotin carboxyl carrier protein
VLKRYSVKIAGRERLVELGADDGGRTRVVVDGVARDVELTSAGGGAWLLREDARQTLADVSGDGGKLTVSIRGPGADVVVVAAEVAEARSASVAAIVKGARGAAAASGPIVVRSPMPGRVVKVLAQAGARVAAGQPIVVVEAMKMENELRAPRAGAIADVRCAEGATVEAGQELVTIAPDPAP